MTRYANGGLELLQMVPEPDTERCGSEEVEPRRRWTRGGFGVPTSILEEERVPTRTLGPERGWIMRSHIAWGEE